MSRSTVRAVSGRTVSGLALAVVVSAGLLTGCGGEVPTPPATEARPGVGEVTRASDGVQEITVQTQDDYVFTPDTFTVEPGRLRLTVLNVGGQMVHNLRFTPGSGPDQIEAGIDLLGAGQEATIDIEVSEPGDYPFECTFHVQLGQVGTMTVRG
jgi:plastocyanin